MALALGSFLVPYHVFISTAQENSTDKEFFQYLCHILSLHVIVPLYLSLVPYHVLFTLATLSTCWGSRTANPCQHYLLARAPCFPNERKNIRWWIVLFFVFRDCCNETWKAINRWARCFAMKDRTLVNLPMKTCLNVVLLAINTLLVSRTNELA